MTDFSGISSRTLGSPQRVYARWLAALRSGDLSIRARRGRRDGGYGSLILELNALAETLKEQRLDDMEAVSLLRNVLGEIDVAVFALSLIHI